MIKNLKFFVYALITASALGLYSSPCAAGINEVEESVASGEQISVDSVDETGAAFSEKAAENGETSVFPAAGVVINLEKIGLNVRLKPWGTILGVLPNSARVTVTGVSGEWYQIEYKGHTAYAYKTYIALNGKATATAGGSTAVSGTKTSGGGVKKPTGQQKRIAEPSDETASSDDDIAVKPKTQGKTAKPAKPSTAAKPADDDNGPAISGKDDASEDETAGGAGTNPNENMTQATGERKGGKFFMDSTGSMSRAAREEAIKKEILAGNTPSFLKNFKEIKVTKKLSDGKEHSISYFAAPDYLAVGSDSDYVRTPMSPVTAQQIADKLGCMLPTAKMVDDIYAQAETKLSPQPMSSGNYPNWQNRMMKSEFYNEHQKLVQSQAAKTGHQDGELVAGHKKDVIISNSLDSHKDKVIIYGWQLKGGKNIQPLSWIHEKSYADYSHGVRLIKREMIVDGKKMDSADVLKDPVLSQLVSKEGPVKNIKANR